MNPPHPSKLCSFVYVLIFKFGRQRQFPLIVSCPQVSQQAAKCIPAMVCPELTEQIRREVAASLHQRKGDFTCYFLTDLVTFTLPAGLHCITTHTYAHTHTYTHVCVISEEPASSQSCPVVYPVCDTTLVYFTCGGGNYTLTCLDRMLQLCPSCQKTVATSRTDYCCR